MVKRNMRPVLKWAGGKTQLLEKIIENMPKEYNRYYEPFAGGAALLFAISPKKAILNDTNKQLVNLYRQIRNNHTEVLKILKNIDKQECNKDFYYKIRLKYNQKIKNVQLDAECAALMIWLNKHCFNGLYRVNSKGLFNVPYNNKVSGASVSEENVIAISNYFNKNNVKITCMDFEKACRNVCKNDFVYFDSPYISENEKVTFTNYTKDGFSYEDHCRLAELFRKLDSIGAKLMLSNNAAALTYKLYKKYNIHSLNAKRMINVNALKRKGNEVIITNY